MAKTLEIIQTELAAPFDQGDVKFRIQTLSGTNALMLPYVDARAIEDRLDSVIGLGGWRDDYIEWQMPTVSLDAGNAARIGEGDLKAVASFISEYYAKAVKCTLSIRDGKEWIAKQGIADNTSIEAVKGGESQALRRAAVKFGMGRYLYNLPDLWLQVSTDKNFGKERLYYNRTNYYYNKPDLAKYVTGKPSQSTNEKITGSNSQGSGAASGGQGTGNAQNTGNQNTSTGSTGGPAPAVSAADFRDWQTRLAPLAQTNDPAKQLLADSNAATDSLTKVSKLLGTCYHLLGAGHPEIKTIEGLMKDKKLPAMVKYLKQCIMDLESRK